MSAGATSPRRVALLKEPVATRPPFEIRKPSAPPKGAAAAPGLAGQDLFWIALAGSVAGFVLLVFRPNRDRIREAEAECRLVRSEIAALEGCVARLRRWERSLASGDRDAWASVARERLGWLQPGEEIVRPRITRSRGQEAGRPPGPQRRGSGTARRAGRRDQRGPG